ncbi:MAG: T9SS type A sorting domain-containing protein [Bacteroidetes bacterium]|nr:T9SS type A sorting domain-containing protein [Bacteroidota bacterium]
MYTPTQQSDLNISFERVYNNINLRMYSLQGKMLSSQYWNIGNAFTLGLPQLSKGLYLLEIVCDEGVVVKKVVIGY